MNFQRHSRQLFFKFGTLNFRKLLLLISICFIIIFLLLRNEDSTINFISNIPLLISYQFGSKSVSGLECYAMIQTDENVIEIVDYSVSSNSIFFLETSCRHGSRIEITKRQACAYESAAKIHPKSEVLVLFPSPITLRYKSELVSQLLSYPNIKFLHIPIKKYFAGTPLENFYNHNTFAKSYWPRSHASDALRYLTLWKYGGTYMDSDIVMIRPITQYQNFAGAESAENVAAGFLNFNLSGPGKVIMHDVINEIRDNFRGWDWGYNGPGVISRVLRRLCNESKASNMTPEKCFGFTVFPPHVFYPIQWQAWKEYFNNNATESTMNIFNKSFAIHVWNQYSYSTPVKVGSKQPYSVFASKFCPKIYSVSGEYF